MKLTPSTIFEMIDQWAQVYGEFYDINPGNEDENSVEFELSLQGSDEKFSVTFRKGGLDYL